jgi:uncharacterized membrane protein YfcA
MEIVGYLASLLIGISLGLIGGGGSILTVPVMVYLFGVSPVLATSYSLFIVGSTSSIGTFVNLKNGNVNIKAALLFGASSIVTVFATRRFLLPLVPKDIFQVNGFMFTGEFLTMVLFAALMLLASFSMIKGKKDEASIKECSKCMRFTKLLGYGIAIGLVTGLLGAGGGFLLIPSLVFLLKLSMKRAVGTSLAIIALNSLIGFTGDLGVVQIDWPFLFIITALAITGIFIGFAIGKKIAGEKLKKGFGWFVLGMGIFILLKELLFS